MEPVDFFILFGVFVILFLWSLFHNPVGTALVIFIIWGVCKLKKKYKNDHKSRK